MEQRTLARLELALKQKAEKINREKIEKATMEIAEKSQGRQMLDTTTMRPIIKIFYSNSAFEIERAVQAHLETLDEDFFDTYWFMSFDLISMMNNVESILYGTLIFGKRAKDRKKIDDEEDKPEKMPRRKYTPMERRAYWDNKNKGWKA